VNITKEGSQTALALLLLLAGAVLAAMALAVKPVALIMGLPWMDCAINCGGQALGTGAAAASAGALPPCSAGGCGEPPNPCQLPESDAAPRRSGCGEWPEDEGSSATNQPFPYGSGTSSSEQPADAAGPSQTSFTDWFKSVFNLNEPSTDSLERK
jgi:hypothetical protein